MYFVTVSAPIEAGLIKEFDKPAGGMISGVSHTIPIGKLVDYTVQMARVLTPKGPLRFGYVHSTYPSEVGTGKKFEKEMATRQGLSIQSSTIQYTPKAVPSMRQNYLEAAKDMDDSIDFYLSTIGPLGLLEGFTGGLVAQSKKPVMFCSHDQSLREGCLLQIDSNASEVGRIAATSISEILAGKPVSDIVPLKVESVRLGVNLKKAKEIGLVIPSNILKLSIDNLVK